MAHRSDQPSLFNHLSADPLEEAISINRHYEKRRSRLWKLTAEQKDEIVRRYVAGESHKALAKAFGSTPGNIHTLLKRRKVPKRTHAEAMRIFGDKITIHDGKTTGKRAYDRCKAKKKCPSCGQQCYSSVLCMDCRKKRSEYRDRLMEQGLCPQCGGSKEVGRRYCPACRAGQRAFHQRLKEQALNAYGGCRCVCCGVTDMVFLCLDHINNNGAEHRRRLGNRGSGIYSTLKRQGYPPGFQVLCHNCNFAKQFGPCPCKKLGNPA